MSLTFLILCNEHLRKLEGECWNEYLVMMASENEEQMELEAEHIFLLMKKEYRISRNTRAQWYFNHLNEVVNIPKAEKIEQFKGEIEIICALPRETPTEWDWDTSHLYQ